MQEKNNTQINLVDIFLFLLSRWWVFLLCALLCVGVAYYRYSKMPFYYRGTSTVMIKRPADTRSSALGNFSSMVNTVNISYEKMQFHSKELMRRVVLGLDADIDYMLDVKLRDIELYDSSPVRMMLVRNSDEDPAPFTVRISPQDATHLLLKWNGTSRRVELGDTLDIGGRRMVFFPTPTYSSYMGREVRIVKNSVVGAVGRYLGNLSTNQFSTSASMLTISLTDRSAKRACDIVNMLVEKYNEESIREKNRTALNTAGFINERIISIQKELSGIEDEMVRFKQEERMTSANSSAEEYLSAGRSYNQQIVQIEMQERLSAYLKEYLYTAFQEYITVPANIGITDASLGSSLSQYNALLLQRMRIQRTATDSNPVVEQLDQQLSSMRQNIIATIRSVRESLQIRLNGLQAQESKINRQIKNAPEQEREYVRVVRDQKIKERLYLFLYEKREENSLMLAATTIPAKILDMPQRDVTSSEPKLTKILMLCFLLGLFLPAGLLYLFVLLNDKIDDPKEFERRINAPLLGKLVENSRGQHIAIREGESTVSAELFRLIRTNLRFMLPAETKAPVILVTSSINGEGKSYVSSNTALSLALLGKKVALVGLDIRKPMLATYFNLNTKGHLTDYLAEPDVTIDDIIVPSGEHKNLDLIPCGAIPPNPSELLQTERLDALFAELRKRYDYIIVDTAPVALVSDTFLLDRIADMTIFVCRYKYTSTEMIDYINQVVEQKRMHNVAGVLNGVKGLRAGYGYGAQQS